MGELITQKFNNNRTSDSVAHRMLRLRLTKDYVPLKIKESQFKKGNVPFNKGRKASEYLTAEVMEKMKATQFAKGGIGGQVRGRDSAVGDERVTRDGFIEIRVDYPVRTFNHSVCGKLNVYWEYKHRYIWKQHYGEIPSGNIITFLDGNKRNFDINNLVMITQSENLMLNKMGLRCGSAELTKTSIQVVKLIMRVKEKGQKNEKRN